MCNILKILLSKVIVQVFRTQCHITLGNAVSMKQIKTCHLFKQALLVRKNFWNSCRALQYRVELLVEGVIIHLLKAS
jgi:hypothetical protein